MRKKPFYVLLVIILGFLSHFFYGFYFSASNTCYTTLNKQINGNSMSPLMESGDKIVMLAGYYNCHEIQSGDIVAYNFANTGNLFVKTLRAVPGNRVELRNNTLYIGEKEMLNSLGNSYHFTSEEQKMISLYITEEGILKNRAYFIFGDNIGNSKDSRKFGGIGKSDIIGKFEFK